MTKNHQLNEKKKTRKRKATKSTRKKIELFFLFKISSESELLSNNNMLT